MPKSLRNTLPAAHQCAALCWRERRGEVEVLLITSRDTGRWVIPKGWLMDGKTSAASAQQEAWEEAGVCGVAFPTPLGTYTYKKPELRNSEVEVIVYPLFVQHMRSDYPEKGLREFAWVPPDDAAELVNETGLRSILAGFIA